jgi:hypothetical protein
VTARRNILVPPAKGPFASMGDGDLIVLDARLDSVDSLNEADPGTSHARKDVLTAGQAAVNELKSRRGRS